MKKILFIATKSGVGGAQKYVADLARRLDKTKFKIKIITGDDGAIRWLSNSFRPYFFFINDWLAFFELIKIFRRERPDIVHLNSSKPGVIGALAAKFAGKNIKVVFTAHGWVFNPDNYNSRLRKHFYIFLHKIAAHFQDVIINVSEYDRALALQYKIAPARKLVVIHNGIDFANALFFDRETARKYFSERIGINLSDKKIIGSIGRLVKEKNYETFINAAARIKNDNAIFIIIGAGPEQKSLAVQIKKRRLTDRFFLVGAIPDSARYLKAFEMFVLSSIKEGLPYTIIEAMGAGVPIVATAAGGLNEILKNRGYLIPLRRADKMAVIIEKILRDKTEAAGRARLAKQYAAANLSLKNMTAKTEDVYNAITAP